MLTGHKLLFTSISGISELPKPAHFSHHATVHNQLHPDESNIQKGHYALDVCEAEHSCLAARSINDLKRF